MAIAVEDETESRAFPLESQPPPSTAVVRQTRVIDVRTPGEYFFQVSGLDEAELVPLADLSLESVSWSLDQPLLVVCDDGRRSEQAAIWLRNRGFQDVRVLEGGLDALQVGRGHRRRR